MENFIRARFDNYNPGRASQKSLRTVPPRLEVKAHFYKFFETEGWTSQHVLVTVYTTQV